MTTLRDQASTDAKEKSDENSDEKLAINYAAKGGYNSPRHNWPKQNIGNVVKNDPLEIMSCFNCDASDHMEKDCTSP